MREHPFRVAVVVLTAAILITLILGVRVRNECRYDPASATGQTCTGWHLEVGR